MSVAIPELQSSLRHHNASFERLLSLIPAAFYFARPEGQDDDKWHRHKKQATEASKESKRQSKAERRRLKLDPDNAKTTEEILKGSNDPADNVKEEEDMDVDMADAEERRPEDSGHIAAMPANQSISEIRQKLHQKIDAVRARRGLGPASSDKRSHDHDEDGAAGALSKTALLKRRRKAAAEQAKMIQRQKALDRKAEEMRKVEETIKADQAPAEQLTFSNVTLPSADRHGVIGEKRKRGPAKSDVAAQLALVQAKKAKLQAMTDDGERAQAIEKQRWADAKARLDGHSGASGAGTGQTVLNDENRLIKAVKRKEKLKTKSAKEWNERKDEVEKGQAERIKKRNENIKAAREAKSQKGKGSKSSSGKKAGGSKAPKKSRAGFEGRKR